MCRNKVLALIAVLCFVFPVAITEAENPKGNSRNGEGAANSNYLNGKPFSALAEAIAEIQAEVEQIQAEVLGMTGNFAELEQRILANEHDISALESQANKVARTLTGAMDTLASLQSDLAALQDDAAANQDDIQALEAEIAQLSSEIEIDLAEMDELLVELRQELDLQKEGLDAFKEEFDLYKAESEQIVTQLKGDLASAISDIKATEGVSGDNLASILLLQGAVANMSIELISLNSSYISLYQRFNEHTHIYYDKWHIIYGIFRVTGRAQ